MCRRIPLSIPQPEQPLKIPVSAHSPDLRRSRLALSDPHAMIVEERRLSLHRGGIPGTELTIQESDRSNWIQGLLIHHPWITGWSFLLFFLTSYGLMLFRHDSFPSASSCSHDDQDHR
jgi:hypothetical protein